MNVMHQKNRVGQWTLDMQCLKGQGFNSTLNSVTGVIIGQAITTHRTNVYSEQNNYKVP